MKMSMKMMMLVKTRMRKRLEHVPDVWQTVTSRSNEKGRVRQTDTEWQITSHWKKFKISCA